MDDNHTLLAVFKLLMYNLTITVTEGGTTDPAPGTYSYVNGTTVLVTAIPYTNYLFSHWELDGVNVGTDNPIKVLMDSDHNLHAVFKLLTYELTITVTDGGTTDPPAGTYVYVAGTEVNVTAIPDPGFSFDYWLLDGENRTENPITIIMDANHTLVPYFVDDKPPNITGVSQSPESVVVEPYENVTVTVSVEQEGTGVGGGVLYYCINRTKWHNVSMDILPTNFGVTFLKASIPGFSAGTEVQYWIKIWDKAGNVAIVDNAGQYYAYTVIPEFSAVNLILIFLALTTLAVLIFRFWRYQSR